MEAYLQKQSLSTFIRSVIQSLYLYLKKSNLFCIGSLLNDSLLSILIMLIRSVSGLALTAASTVGASAIPPPPPSVHPLSLRGIHALLKFYCDHSKQGDRLGRPMCPHRIRAKSRGLIRLQKS